MKKICNIVSIFLKTKEKGGSYLKTNYEVGPEVVYVKEFTNQSVVDDYSEYYEWLHSSLEADSRFVIQESLDFLDKTYENLLDDMEERISLGKCCKRLLVIDKHEKTKLKMQKYIDNTKKIYDSISSVKDHDNYYKYYDDLGSWYCAQIDSTDRVLEKLSASFLKKYEKKNLNRIYIKTEVDNERCSVCIIL